MDRNAFSALTIAAIGLLAVVGTVALGSDTASASNCIGAGTVDRNNLSCIGWGKTDAGDECIGYLKENDKDGDDCDGIDP